MSTGKAPGTDGIPLSSSMEARNCYDSCLICSPRYALKSVQQDFKDALIVHVYKRKGDRAVCDNHRGISLLSVAGKVLARILLNRLGDHVDSSAFIPESQCGFRAGRGVTYILS